MRDSKGAAARGDGESIDGLRPDGCVRPLGRTSDEPRGESGDEALALPLRGNDELKKNRFVLTHQMNSSKEIFIFS